MQPGPMGVAPSVLGSTGFWVTSTLVFCRRARRSAITASCDGSKEGKFTSTRLGELHRVGMVTLVSFGVHPVLPRCTKKPRGAPVLANSIRANLWPAFQTQDSAVRLSGEGCVNGSAWFLLNGTPSVKRRPVYKPSGTLPVIWRFISGVPFEQRPVPSSKSSNAKSSNCHFPS